MRTGARMGPEAIRKASAGLYPYHRRHRRVLHAQHAIEDAGDVAVVPMSVDRTHRAIRAHLDRFPDHVRVLLLGGDHSVVLPHLEWMAERRGPIALIHLDAHHDLWDEFWGEPLNHATVFRRAVDRGLVDTRRSIQVGIRGTLDDQAEDHYGEELGLRQISTDDWYSHGHDWVVNAIRERVSGAPSIYVSVDIDVVDPAFAPGTGTPEAGGPTSYMVFRLLQELGLEIHGGDVVELAPDLDVTGNSSLFSATVAQELLFLITHPGI